MPKFLLEEMEQAAATVLAIAAHTGQRRRARLSQRLDLSLSAAIPLLQGLGGGTRAVLIRQLLQRLGFDERRHSDWRLEHKLMQALVLSSYCPEFVPVTCGLSAVVAAADARQIRELLNLHFPGGYLIKTALGDSSGERPSGDLTGAMLSRVEGGSFQQASGGLLSEEYVVQERVPIACEYRVHSLEEKAVEDLTFRRYAPGSIPGERDRPNAFVESVLARLPDGIVGGSLLAWDIALTPSGSFTIIEVNFSGFHPVFKRGFHCSGYYHDYNWGSCDTARLLNHVTRTDGVPVAVHADAPSHPEENRFYAEVAQWQSRHWAAHAGTER